MSASKTFSAAADKVAKLAGKPVTFLISVGLIVIWAVTGQFFIIRTLGSS